MTNQPAPTPPPARPTPGGDLRNRPRPPAPSPTGARSNWSPLTTTPNNHPDPAPGASSNLTPEHPDCETCSEYLDKRGTYLAHHLVAAARERRIPARQLVVEYINGLHARHVAGGSIEVR